MAGHDGRHLPRLVVLSSVKSTDRRDDSTICYPAETGGAATTGVSAAAAKTAPSAIHIRATAKNVLRSTEVPGFSSCLTVRDFAMGFLGSATAVENSSVKSCSNFYASEVSA